MHRAWGRGRRGDGMLGGRGGATTGEGDGDDEQGVGVGGEGGVGVRENEKLPKISEVLAYIASPSVPVGGTNLDQSPPSVPVGATNRDQRSLFSSPKGGKQRPLVPVGGTNQD